MGKRFEQTLHQRRCMNCSKHMKRCSSLVTRKMQIKLTVRYHCTLLKWQKLKQNNKILALSSSGKYVEQLEHSHSTGSTMHNSVPQSLQKTVGQFLRVKHTLIMTPSTPMPRYLPKRNENGYIHTFHVHTKTKQMSIAALFIIIKIWKQS